MLKTANPALRQLPWRSLPSARSRPSRTSGIRRTMPGDWWRADDPTRLPALHELPCGRLDASQHAIDVHFEHLGSGAGTTGCAESMPVWS